MAKNKGGRPTDYKEEYCQQIIDYFDKPPFFVTYKKEYFQNGQLKSETPILQANEFPTFQGFAHSIGVTVSTMWEWCNAHEKFSKAYARAKELQEKIWSINAMQNLYNSQFAQFFGKNCLGYKDTQQIESKNVNVNETLDGMTAEARQKRIEELLNK